MAQELNLLSTPFHFFKVYLDAKLPETEENLIGDLQQLLRGARSYQHVVRVLEAGDASEDFGNSLVKENAAPRPSLG